MPLLRIRSKIVPTKKPPWCIEPLCSANIAPHRKQRHPHAPLPMLLSSCRTMTFRCLLAQDLGDAGIALPRPTLRAACAPRAAFLAQPLLQRRPRLPRSAGARLASHGGRVTLSDCEPEKIVFALNTQRKHLHCPDSGHYVRPGPTQLLSCIRIMYMNFSRSRFFALCSRTRLPVSSVAWQIIPQSNRKRHCRTSSIPCKCRLN